MSINNSEVNAVLDRLKQVYVVDKDSELAKSLEITPQTLSTWKARDKVPYSICVQISKERNLTLDWLLTGEGQMYKNAPPPEQQLQALTPKERALLELFKELNDKDQREIYQDAEQKKHMSDLERELKELKSIVEQQKNVG